MDDLRFVAKVYSGDKFVGVIHEETYKDCIRKATKLCNDHYNSVDRMYLGYYDGDDFIGEIYLFRINKKFPNNTIVRGKWN